MTRQTRETTFYQGWMIELVEQEENFQFICCSSSRQTFSDGVLYVDRSGALQAAFRLINQCLACAALQTVLRDVFEAKRLSFDEWQGLARSLDHVSQSQLIRSPF